MTEETMTSTAATKHTVTIDVQVVREVSVDEVRTYLLRKGFRLGSRDSTRDAFACTLYTLVPVGQTTATSPCVFLFDHDPTELRRSVVAAARCLDRPVADVLREIVGEVVTLEDAKAALVRLYLAALDDGTTSLDLRAPGPPWALVQEAVEFAELATMLGNQHGQTALAKAWLRVAHAAEDLASIAIAELRRQRDAAPTEGSSS